MWDIFTYVLRRTTNSGSGLLVLCKWTNCVPWWDSKTWTLCPCLSEVILPVLPLVYASLIGTLHTLRLIVAPPQSTFHCPVICAPDGTRGVYVRWRGKYSQVDKLRLSLFIALAVVPWLFWMFSSFFTGYGDGAKNGIQLSGVPELDFEAALLFNLLISVAVTIHTFVLNFEVWDNCSEGYVTPGFLCSVALAVYFRVVPSLKRLGIPGPSLAWDEYAALTIAGVVAVLLMSFAFFSRRKSQTANRYVSSICVVYLQCAVYA
eukprot:Lankesteria_metandrocarpae@DN1655_c0_g1_i1.p1